jgi:predicted acylesterase/phospholipase RssA
LVLQGGSLVKFEPIEKTVEDMIVEKVGFVPTLAELETVYGKSLICVTYNLSDNKREYLSAITYPELPLTKAIRMSSNFPFIFEQCEVDGKYYVDGGITDNFPMNFAQTESAKCLGIYNINPPKPFNPDGNYLTLLQRLFMIFVCSMAETAKPASPKSKIFKLEFEFSFFNFNASNDALIKLFDLGYDRCKDLTTD